jgi:hypothetical protein
MRGHSKAWQSFEIAGLLGWTALPRSELSALKTFPLHLTLVGLGSVWGVMTARQDAADRVRVEDRAAITTCVTEVSALKLRVNTLESEGAGRDRLWPRLPRWRRGPSSTPTRVYPSSLSGLGDLPKNLSRLSTSRGCGARGQHLPRRQPERRYRILAWVAWRVALSARSLDVPLQGAPFGENVVIVVNLLLCRAPLAALG